MLLDLAATRERLRAGETSCPEEMERCIALAQSAACAHSFVRPMFDEARAEATQNAVGKKPLAGLSVSVKDLFDIARQPTRAGSIALAHAAPAAQDCAAVARLRTAGAAIVGRTHMVEFAFSGVGINPHFDTPCAWDARFGALPNPARIPGGSSSGAAVSVSTGAAFIGLGSDTGGSIRIPAAFNGIVGFKNTARLVPIAGAIPLSTTLDTVCALTRSVSDAIIAHEVLATRRVARDGVLLAQRRLAVPNTLFLDGLHPTVAQAFHRSLESLRNAGACIEELRLPLLNDMPTGSLSAAESYAWHHSLLAQSGHLYDPRVRARIEKGAAMSAREYIQLLRDRSHWIERMESVLAPFDALLSPTVPIVAPALADVAPGAERDTEFFRINALLLRNTSPVNMLDGCALSLPCHVQGELPVGMMVWHGALHDDAVLNIGLQIEEVLQNRSI